MLINFSDINVHGPITEGGQVMLPYDALDMGDNFTDI